MPNSDTVDLLIRGTLVDVNTGTLRETPVAVDDGEIVALAERPAARELRAEYIAPGLIDAHIHVESSMVTVPRYGEAVLKRGITSIVTDPHEIANVCGIAGVRGMMADAEHTPLKARFTVPSSVPASHLQDAGAALGVEAVTELLDADLSIALGEVMNIPGVLAGDSEVMGKIAAARERSLTVDGHAPKVTGDDLQIVAAHLDTDHESTTQAEALEKLQLGMRVFMREGTCSKDLDALVGLVADGEVDSRHISVCSDDRDVVELDELGSVDYAVRRVIEHGVDPVEAVQLATINTAEAYNLPFGRVEPGAPADMVLLSDLESWAVEHVIVDGVVDPDAPEPPETAVPRGTVEFDPVEPEELVISHEGTSDMTGVEVRVIDATGGLQTERMTAEVPVVDGPGESPTLGVDTESDIVSLSVIDRHGNGGIGNGFVHGLGIKRGAVGTTVAHDAHNCLVAGATPEAMARVANHLRETGGGVAAFDPADGIRSLALPVGGVMADEPLAAVKAEFEAVAETARAIGLARHDGIHTLTFLALEVIPELRLTNRGLVDVEAFAYVDVVV